MGAPAPMRFLPPTAALPGDIQWVLARALAPASVAADPPGAGAVDLATALGLDARIGSRIEPRQLAQEAGRVAAARFLQATATVREREGALADLIATIRAAAEPRVLPLVFLKYAGLLLAGRLRPGSRAAADIDVLVSRCRLRDAVALLERLGFSTLPTDPDPHQLPALRDSQGRVVELHRHIPHLSVPNENGPATYEALAHKGALVSLGAGCHHLATALAAAHAIAHAVAQNGFFPATSPFLRTVADLVDLGTPEWASGTAPLRSWLARDLVPDEVEGCLDLAAWCARARLPPPASAAGRLLAHAVWGALDESYRSDLRAEYLRQLPRRALRSPEARSALRRVLFPSVRSFEQIYGFPRDTLRGRFTFVTRPLALAWRHLRTPRGVARGGAARRES